MTWFEAYLIGILPALNIAFSVAGIFILIAALVFGIIGIFAAHDGEERLARLMFGVFRASIILAPLCFVISIMTPSKEGLAIMLAAKLSTSEQISGVANEGITFLKEYIKAETKNFIEKEHK